MCYKKGNAYIFSVRHIRVFKRANSKDLKSVSSNSVDFVHIADLSVGYVSVLCLFWETHHETGVSMCRPICRQDQTFES